MTRFTDDVERWLKANHIDPECLYMWPGIEITTIRERKYICYTQKLVSGEENVYLARTAPLVVEFPPHLLDHPWTIAPERP